MKRTVLTLLILVGLVAVTAATAQAGSTTAIAGSLAAQTVAKPPHFGPGHHDQHGHYGYPGPCWHHGHRPHPAIYAPYPPVVVQPYVYRYPYILRHGSFYYSSPNFSFGFGY